MEKAFPKADMVEVHEEITYWWECPKCKRTWLEDRGTIFDRVVCVTCDAIYEPVREEGGV